MGLKKIVYVIVLCFNVTFFDLHAKANVNHIVLFSIPKCGTHLLLKVLQLLTGNKKPEIFPRGWCLLDNKTMNLFFNNQVLLRAHAIYVDANIKRINVSTIKTFFIYRDPRDQIVSAALWIKKNSKWARYDLNVLIDALIFGGGAIWGTMFLAKDPWRHLKSIVDFYNLYLPWAFEPNVYATTFEKLVGPKGGGNEDVQLKEIMAIADYIGKKITLKDAKNVANQLFGGTSTFREGKIGAWKKHLLPRHIKALQQLPGFNELLCYLGYEKNKNWGIS